MELSTGSAARNPEREFREKINCGDAQTHRQVAEILEADGVLVKVQSEKRLFFSVSGLPDETRVKLRGLNVDVTRETSLDLDSA